MRNNPVAIVEVTSWLAVASSERSRSGICLPYLLSLNELDAATFKRRISTIDSLFDVKTVKCFEQLIAANTPSPIPLMDLDDLRTDIASLKGERVRVKAVGYYMMNMLMLKKGLADMSPIIVDISNLQRDQRRQVLQQCGDIMAGCHLAITGTVKQLSSQIQLSAESIEVQ